MLKVQLEKKNLPFDMAEEIKNLRTSIIFSGEDIKTVVFTSCVANEGKSTISIETVRSFAEMGRKALYIDCDLRKSLLERKIHEGKIEKGLTHYLTGQCKLEEIIYNNDGNEDVSFDLIPSGPYSSSPTELLSSEKFRNMLADIRKKYDIIIIDTPPLMSIVDASIVSTNADGAVLVVEAGNVNYKVIQKTRDKLLQYGARILGVVLNKVDRSRKNYGYYKYGYGYGISNNVKKQKG
ncbi:MAG: CpsD/CapB family tyrosine-protein kinase [Butyrivibrio sp.]|nr:CpsD/CapB family tyrosine-protein kinase [Butyrivibrio sp.]